MPGFNQQGPMGQGPMTGRKMGRCTNFGIGRRNQTTPENIENPTDDFFPRRGAGRGMGKGLGRGMGRNGSGGGRGQGCQNRFRGGW